MNANGWKKRASIVALISVASMTAICWAKGPPVTHQESKDFRNYIIQGERPEIAACMAVGFNVLRHDRKFAEVRWLDTTSDTALMHESEIGDHILREISLDAQAIVRSTSFLDVWVNIKVQCEQRDEGYPIVRVSITGSD